MFRATDWGRPSRVSHLGLKCADHYFLIVRVWGRFVVHGAMMNMMLSPRGGMEKLRSFKVPGLI